MSTNIQFVQRQGMLILLISSKSSMAEFSSIPQQMADQLGSPGTPGMSAIVVDMEDQKLSADAWKALCQNLLDIAGRHTFFFIRIADGTKSSVLSFDPGSKPQAVQSLEAVFETLQTTKKRNAKSTAPKKRGVDDAELDKLMISIFQDAAIRTLGIQCSTEFKAGKASVKNAQAKPGYDIAASMGMLSKKVSGSVALGFKEETFLEIMNRMLGEKYDSITTDVEDGCGELLNIIFGQAKKALNEKGHLFGKTLPTIFSGPALRVRPLTPSPSLVLPFESDLGEMTIELGLRHT